MRQFFHTYGLFFAWLISLFAMLITLFFSEILQWPVCPLCWYQRLAIYPLVILLGMAAYKNDRTIISYVIPFPIIGLFFSVYQYLEQMIPGFAPIDFCKAGAVSCSVIHLKLFGFVTIPFLSAVACVLIFVFLLFARDCQNRQR